MLFQDFSLLFGLLILEDVRHAQKSFKTLFVKVDYLNQSRKLSFGQMIIFIIWFLTLANDTPQVKKKKKMERICRVRIFSVFFFLVRAFDSLRRSPGTKIFQNPFWKIRLEPKWEIVSWTNDNFHRPISYLSLRYTSFSAFSAYVSTNRFLLWTLVII